MQHTSITTKSYLTDHIAAILQESRVCLVSTNPNVYIGDADSHKITLLCLLHLLTHTSENDLKFSMPSTLESLVCELYDSEWVYDFYPNTNQFANISVFECYKTLIQICTIDEWETLFTYALETFEYSPEQFFSAKINRGVRKIDSNKKALGIYYTPEDVTSYMIEKCVNDLDAHYDTGKTYLDCSCGVGIFLLQIADYLRRQSKEVTSEKAFLGFIKTSIWGIDLSDKAILNSKFAFMAYAYVNFTHQISIAKDLWHTLNEHFICADATALEDVLRTHPEMPSKYDCIIGNPPYVTLGRNDNLYIRFVENMIAYSSNKSCSALILPLSICYSQGSSYTQLRGTVIEDKKATWIFDNFDRSPDSLFGDHVKTRNTIAFRSTISGSHILSSTGIIRWTSKNRDILFNNITTTDITEVAAPFCIPKLQCSLEVDAYKKLKSDGSTVGSMFKTRTDEKNYYIAANGTAYNWICVYDHIPPSVDKQGNPYQSSSMSIFPLALEDDVYFCIAVLSNRITYWYWTVIGDAFHVNSAFYDHLYLGKESFSNHAYRQMVQLGREYCSQIISYPTYSFNAGKKMVNYDYKKVFPIVKTIEKEIIEAKHILPEFLSYIASWYDNHISCGRN